MSLVLRTTVWSRAWSRWSTTRLRTHEFGVRTATCAGAAALAAALAAGFVAARRASRVDLLAALRHE